MKKVALPTSEDIEALETEAIRQLEALPLPLTNEGVRAAAEIMASFFEALGAAYEPLQLGILLEMKERPAGRIRKVAYLGQPPEEWLEEWEEIRQPPGTPLEAAQRLAAMMPPGLRDPQARRALYESARAQKMRPKALLSEKLFPDGLLLASGEKELPRMGRIGKNWVKNSMGKKTPFKPIELSIFKFIPWLLSEAYRATATLLLGRPYPGQGPDPLDRAIPWEAWGKENWEHKDQDREARLLISSLYEPCEDELYDASRQQDEVYTLLWDIASPCQREILPLLKKGFSPQEIAALKKIERSTVYVQLHRLRKKVQKAYMSNREIVLSPRRYLPPIERTQKFFGVFPIPL